jgi:DDE superfamily endonuclease
MTRFLADQRHWLEVKRLPAYAPELNPAEGFWSNLKGQELAQSLRDARAAAALDRPGRCRPPAVSSAPASCVPAPRRSPTMNDLVMLLREPL